MDAAKIWKTDYQAASAAIVEFEKVVSELKKELAKVTAEKNEIQQKATEEKEAIEEVGNLVPRLLPLLVLVSSIYIWSTNFVGKSEAKNGRN